MDEIKRLQKLDLQRETLRNVRDIFLLQYFTGLSYGDVKRLSLSDIHEVAEGEYWIKMEREKTKVHFSVPLLPPAQEILESFWKKESGEKLLPVLMNQKMNENLKIIQELASINKSLTTHLARHTFATTITLANGVPGESQLSAIARDYYKDQSFCRTESGNINLWRVYNLFTGANKSSYIDTFLDRNCNATEFVSHLKNALAHGQYNWFLG